MKYTSLTNLYIFQPIAVESHATFSGTALSFLTSLGERLTGTYSDVCDMSYLLWKFSAFQFGLNTWEICFSRWRTGHL